MPTEYAGIGGTELLGRNVHFSQEAEEAVLGSMMLEPACVDKVTELIKTSDYFYRPQHQKLFSLIMRKFANGSNEDVVTLINESVTAGIFDNSSMARTYLMGLVNNVPSVSNIESYCKIINEKYQIRTLVGVADDIIKTANEGSMEPDAMLDNAEQKIFDIRQGRSIEGLTHIRDVIVGTFAHLQEISGADAEKSLGARSGFPELDKITTGLNRTDLIVLAARPAMGKSAFALNIAVNCCKATKREVAVFSLEMGKEQLVSRILASEALVNNTNMRNGQISDDDWDRLASTADMLQDMPLYLDDGAGVTVPQMKAKLRRMRNLGLVVIDYIQLMQSPNKHSNRVNEVSEITRQLKLMAKELNVPVIALSQLSRSSEKRDDKRPMLSDLRESGSIEQDADIIMFLYRDSYYNDATADKSIAECIVAKNRHGQTDTIKLGWKGDYTRFSSLEFRKDEL